MNKFNIKVVDKQKKVYEYYIETEEDKDQLANRVYEGIELGRPIKIAYYRNKQEGFAIFNGKEIVAFEIEDYKVMGVVVHNLSGDSVCWKSSVMKAKD